MTDIDTPMWQAVPAMAGAFLVVLGIVVAPLFYVGHRAAIAEQARWEVFAAEHNCRVVESRQGRSSTVPGYGLTTNGQYGYGLVTTSTPDEEAWRCDDGVTYWRRAR